MNLTLSTPKITVIDGFLLPEECETVVQLLAAIPHRISTINNGADLQTANQIRLSETIYESEFSEYLKVWCANRLDTRIADLLGGLCLCQFEGWQSTRFSEGHFFKPHRDVDESVHPDNKRNTTAIIYLNTTPQGGETHFNHLRLSVQPVQGRLLLFSNLLTNRDIDPEMLHEAKTVIEGQKHTLINWIREKSIK